MERGIVLAESNLGGLTDDELLLISDRLVILVDIIATGAAAIAEAQAKAQAAKEARAAAQAIPLKKAA